MRFAAANFATALGASTLKMRVDRARHCWAHALSTSAEAQRRHLGDALNLWAHPVCSKGKSLLGKYSALKTSGLLHSLSPSHRAREKSRDLYKAFALVHRYAWTIRTNDADPVRPLAANLHVIPGQIVVLDEEEHPPKATAKGNM